MTNTSNFIELKKAEKIWAIGSIHSNLKSFNSIKEYILNNFKKPDDFFIPQSASEKAKAEEWCLFSLMELDCLSIYILRKHEKPENLGLSNIYGEADNAIKAARMHFDKMIAACEKNVPENSWLLSDSPCIADIIFTSCLIHCDNFNLKIKSNKVKGYLERAKSRKQFKKAFEDCFNSN